MRSGFDWSGGWPGIEAIRAQGGSFAGRYLAYDHPRGITAGEVGALNAAGMDIISFYEENESSIMQGWDFGVRAGRNGLQILASCGQHLAVPIHIACDFDITASQMNPVYAALDGLASVVGRQNAGIYGGVVPVHMARKAGKATYAVQAGAWRYRAGEVGVSDPYGWSPYAQTRQDGYNLSLNGIGADHLTALAGDFGQWRRPGIITPTPPQHSPTDAHQFDTKPMLREGDNSPDVATVKFVLNYALRAKLTVNNHFDHNTYQSVYFWQGLAKLKQDGVVGASTWKSFGSYVARVHRFDLMPLTHYGSKDVKPGFKPGVAYNPTEWPVHTLQIALNQVTVHGLTPLVLDGIFGPKMRNAVAQYQRNRHITPNGECDKTTWADLGVLLTHYGR